MFAHESCRFHPVAGTTAAALSIAQEGPRRPGAFPVGLVVHPLSGEPMATKKTKKTDETPTSAAPAAAPPAPAVATAPAPAAVPQQAAPAMPVPGMMAPAAMMPGMMPPGMPNPGMMNPGAMAPGMMPAMNPMFAMIQMMQMFGGMGAGAAVDPAAVPFAAGAAQAEAADKGLDADIIRPATLTDRIRHQQAVPLGSVLDVLCLTDDAQHSLGGIPKGCTIAFAGPPGKGKTRSAIAGLAKVALSGEKVAFVVAEEGFHNAAESGRDDLCSRLTKIGMAVTGLGEDEFAAKVLANVFVMECQYHKGTTWDDFVGKYRYLVEKENITFVVIDSLNMLDPTRNRTADNLSALKTYNHEKGITCLCLGQIRDTGMPAGGEALQHTADAVFLIEELSLGSKEIAEQWGGKYRDKIDVISCVKSVTTPKFEHPVRLARMPGTGVLTVHDAQPGDMTPLPAKAE
jgi:KaiC/GvpD/RAD55 family RecA-like ATPase